MKKIDIPVQLVVILAGVAGISYLHYFTPLSQPVLHDIFQRLYYLPIILV